MANPISTLLSLVDGNIKTWKRIEKAINSFKNAPKNLRHWKTTGEVLHTASLRMQEAVKTKLHSKLAEGEENFCKAIGSYLTVFEQDLNELLQKIPNYDPDRVASKGALARFKARSTATFWNEITLNKEFCKRVDRNINLFSVSAIGLLLWEPGPRARISEFIDEVDKHVKSSPGEDNLLEDFQTSSHTIAKRAAARDFPPPNAPTETNLSSPISTPARHPSLPDLMEHVSVEELRCRFKAAFYRASQLFDAGLFTIAADFQLDAIELAGQLRDCQVSFPEVPGHVSLEETYITILMSCKKYDSRAHEKALKRLDELAMAVRETSNQQSAIDACEENHKVGELYARLEEPKKAIPFLRLALLRGYFCMNVMEYHSKINELSQLLGQQYDHGGQFTESQGIRDLVQITLARHQVSDSPELSKTREWSLGKGFSITKEGQEFRFIEIKNEKGNTPLHEAALDLEIDPDVLPNLMNSTFYEVEDRNGDTPLLVAAEKANQKVLQALLSVSCLVHVRDRRRQTPLHRCQDPNSLELLISVVNRRNSTPARQDIEPVTIDSMAKRDTALHLACRRGRIDLVEKLVDGGAKVNVSCELKQTPLMIACMADIPKEKREKIIKLLVDNEAEVSQADIQDNTAKSYLKKRGYRNAEIDSMFSSNHPRTSEDSGVGSMASDDRSLQEDNSSSEQGSLRRSSRSMLSFRFGRTFSSN